MTKTFLIFLLLTVTANGLLAQPQSREQLEKQRQDLKKEIEETEKMLQKNKAATKENLVQWQLVSKKVNLQGKVIDNISKDLNVLNNNIYTIQKDISRYNRLLDTLKREYAKSMVYAYKNRSNYEFLNFIFSASDFNDAIKRITYLKSYRNYREMQGENIIRTQELRRKRVADLSGTKVKKNQTLQEQTKEMATLASEQKEKDRIVAELKKQGKQLNQQISAKQSQMKKVNSAIASAIKRAQEEAIREAKVKADREKAAAAKIAAASPGTPAKPAPKPEKPVRKPAESVLLNDANIALNESFEKNKGSLPWPLDRGTLLMHYGMNKLPSGGDYLLTNITLSAEIGTPVKSVFNGTVYRVVPVEDMQVVIIQHGRYFTTYSNLHSVSVNVGQDVKTGHVLGKVAPNFDGVGTMDFFMSNEKSNFDPETWLRKR